VFPEVAGSSGKPIDFHMFGRAIAEFEFTLVFANAPIDQFARGDRDAMTTGEKRGALLFFGKAECVTCHGAQARGTDNGPNLMRSVLFLRDRYGSEIGPFLKKGHPLQSGKPASSLSDEQITNISHFLRKQLNDTLRGATVFTVQDIRTGDAKAGAEFFNGAGKCTTCHSATGDLAGLAGKYETVDIQQRMLFPGGGGRGRRGGPPPKSAVRVSVTPQGGAAVSGVLVYMDDFVVTLQDENGMSRTFRRTPAVKVQKTDPLEAHHALLETITDKQIHDVVAYLETLK